MSKTATAVDQRMIAFFLPSIPESVRVARSRARTALGLHGLDEYADDVEIVTSELVTNAIQHVVEHPGETIGVTLARALYPVAVAVIVSDSSPEGPIWRQTSGACDRGRGLQLVEALPVYRGWRADLGGKGTFAMIATEK